MLYSLYSSLDKTTSYEDGAAASQGGARVRRSPDLTSTSSEHYVEVAVVADWSMINYHGAHELEAYIFTLMNMVPPHRDQTYDITF